MSRCYILGAVDPEMDRIEEVLRAAGVCIIHAKKDGKRVHAGNAYDANNASDIPKDFGVIFVECAVAHIVPNQTIDHHRPGDHGYDKGPTEYWEASSLGQLHKHLSLNPTPEDFVLAAMDHCYNAAMKEACPGVSRSSVLERKVHEIARVIGCSVTDVEIEVNRFQENLPKFEWFLIGSARVIDVREHTGIGYTLAYLAAQVAATLSEVAVILHLHNEQGGYERLHLCGDVSPDTARCFMKYWAPARGLTDIYGNPDRGYAGGYKQK